jgi:transcriptional regulator with XRE-family HTH domain
MPHENFSINLRIVCDKQISVAHVCRKMEINRQQFNKYLSGQIYPSKYNLNKICQYFQFSEEELNLKPSKFRQITPKSLQSESNSEKNELEKIIDLIPSQNKDLSRYEGYYFSHFHSSGYPGYIIRSLIHIYNYKNKFYSTSIEHLWDKENGDTQRKRFKYEGAVFYLRDRIFITEVETLTNNVIHHTILCPSYKNIVDSLSGISMGVGSRSSHMPAATRVEFLYLGKQISIREALRNCGLFKINTKLIDSNIIARINNEINDPEFMLRAYDT